MSGRALRRLPVLALAKYISSGSIVSFASVPSGINGHGKSKPINGSAGGAVSSVSSANVDVWLSGMESVVLEQADQKDNFL